MTRGSIIAVFGMLALAANVQAQSSVYTQTQMNALYRRNSVSNFTSNQLRSNIYNRTVPRYNYSDVNRNLFSGVLNNGPGAKPFQNSGGGGSVTPWLALSSPFSSPTQNYYTQVRPQLDQQRINQQQAMRNEQLRRQLTSMAARGPYSATGSETLAPTGHGAVYMNYGSYYTPVQTTKQR